MTRPVPDIATAQEPVGEGSTLLNEAKALWLEFRGLVHDRVQLVALETQQAGKSLVSMVISGVAIGLLLVTAWLGLLSAVILWLIYLGLMTSLAILLGVIANLVLAAFLYQSMRRQSRHLGWPATLRSLQSAPPMKESNNDNP